MDNENYKIDDDFNLEDDYKPAPLIPQGNYTANVLEVKLGENMIIFKLCMEGNEGAMMNNGELPVDGQHEQYIIWLPKPEDKDTYTKDGKMTKRQWKLNNMAEVFQKMRISVNKASDIMTAIEEQSWIGIPVIVKVGIGEYQGRPRNEITDIAYNEHAE